MKDISLVFLTLSFCLQALPEVSEGNARKNRDDFSLESQKMYEEQGEAFLGESFKLFSSDNFIYEVPKKSEKELDNLFGSLKQRAFKGEL